MIRYYNRLAPLINTILYSAKFNNRTAVVQKSFFKPIIYTTTRHVHVTQKLFDKSIVTFEELKKLTKDKSTYIVDVREPKELQDTGVIPGSINIPLGEVENALKKLDNEEFKKRYGREKPNVNTQIVFSCQKGVRSKKAFDTAKSLGYKNSSNYVGGWAEWSEKNK